MIDKPRMAALHARLILEAREAEAIAARNPDHRERELVEAELRRAEAADLARLLGIEPPPPGELSLFSDGVTT